MTNSFNYVICLIVTLLLATSCANYKIHNNSIANKLQDQSPDPQLPVTHSIYLIGDVGSNTDAASNPTLTLLKKHLDKASENSSVIFLGNNVSPMGMPSKGKEQDRQKAESQLDAQLNILDNFKGQPVFLPGNQDWGRYGLKGVRRQEEYIETALNKGKSEDDEEDDWDNYFLPDDGCPGPEVIEVNDDLVIIVIDSQWWLMDWDEEPNVNEGCEVKSREAFALLIESTIKDYKKKNIVFASHHSFRSAGPHGGNFTAKDHIFPLTMAAKNAYVPLPVVGSLFLFLKERGIFKQDLANRHYKELRETVIEPAHKNGEFIFVSGHENSLQYLQDEGQHFVVSGSGTKKTATAKDPKAIFSYGQLGFSKIDFYEDGSAWATFFTVNENGSEGKASYRFKIKGPLEKVEPEELPTSFPEYESGIDSLLTFPSSRKIKPSNAIGSFMLGDLRREVYLEKNNFATLDLSTFKGGATVIKKGGGKQTNSLRLLGADGNEYVMRSLTKDPDRAIPYPFNKLVVVNYLFSETFLGTHCYAPLTLGTLSDAANIYHTNPELYYIPKQPALGKYNDHFGGEVYLVEERPSESWPEADFFGNAEKFASTPKLNRKRRKNHKHRVDQKWVARSRLFDILIGDIDRHGDQWRWAVTQTDKGYKLYRPIPRDRDNAYCHFDGFAFKILKPYHYIAKMLVEYDETVPNLEGVYFNARHFDHNYLNELSLEDWQKEAAFIQEQITDEVIKQSISQLPKKIYELTGPGIEKVLKARRDNLQETAKRMYLYLAKKSIVHGTAKKELFEVIRIDDELTEVNMYDTNKEGEKQELLFHRVFKTSETDQLYLFGLEDDDIFHISGTANKGIEIYVVGGLGKDKFIDESKVKGFGKKDHFYDSKKGNELQLGTEGRDRTSKVTKNNTYEYLGNHFDGSKFMPFPLVKYNTSDGFQLGFTGIYHTNAFNKSPTEQLHKLSINYAFVTKGIDAEYNGVFFEATNTLDFVVNANYRSNRYSFNYFGIGNETTQEIDDIDFYRVLQSMTHLDFGLQQRFANDLGSLSIRPLIQRSEVTNTEDRFVNSENNGLTNEDFEARWYTGGVASLNISNKDNNASPKDGFAFNNSINWRTNLTGSNRKFVTFGTDFTAYKSFFKKRSLVVASRVGTELIRGNYDFFFVPAIGQQENIRGYYGQRFRGETTFFHTTDLRLSLGSYVNPILPFSFGITGSFDYGRVFEPNDPSDLWHGSYGGGIWIVPLNLAIVSISYNHSVDGEGGIFSVGVGHGF